MNIFDESSFKSSNIINYFLQFDKEHFYFFYELNLNIKYKGTTGF